MDSLPEALRSLYSDRAFSPVAWTNPSDYSYICIHLIERSVARLAGELSGELLDVGCGAQPYNSYFSHVARKVNCDYDATRGTVDFTCSATEIPVDDESFDSILCTEVLEHVPEPIRAWEEFHRILRKGGKVLLTTPMYWPAHELPYDFYRYPEHGLRYLAERAGFKVDVMMPRGGVYAFLGQILLMGLQKYFRPELQRKLWNQMAIKADRMRCNPRMTLGWTILATK